jgi:hypothetical protein
VKRVLALVAAVAMVAGAYAVRGGGFGGLGDDDGTATAGGGPAEVLRLLCAAELAAVCELVAEADERIEVEQQAPGDTADALVQGEEVPADVWLTPRPWVGIVDELGDRENLGEATDVLARSPLVLAAFDRTLPDCGGDPVGWRCIGDAAGRLRPGIQELDDTEGLFTLGQAGTSFLGTEDYPSNDFESPPEGGGPTFAEWAATLLDAVPRGTFGTPVANMLRIGDATYDFAATIEAVAVSAIRGTRQEGSLQVTYPSPMATVDVVAVPVAGGEEAAQAELLDLLVGEDGRQALAQAGWRVEGEALAPGLDPDVQLAPEDGLPEPGVLAALRDRLG